MRLDRGPCSKAKLGTSDEVLRRFCCTGKRLAGHYCKLGVYVSSWVVKNVLQRDERFLSLHRFIHRHAQRSIFKRVFVDHASQRPFDLLLDDAREASKKIHLPTPQILCVWVRASKRSIFIEIILLRLTFSAFLILLLFSHTMNILTGSNRLALMLDY